LAQAIRLKVSAAVCLRAYWFNPLCRIAFQLSTGCIIEDLFERG